MINESCVPLQSTLKRFTSDQLIDRNFKSLLGAKNFQSSQGNLPKAKCLVCHHENYTKNEKIKMQVNSILVKSDSLLIKNSFQEENFFMNLNLKDNADQSQCISNSLTNSALIYPCLCSTACHKICLMNFCVVNMNFLCKNCEVKFPIKFIKQHSFFDNKWIQSVILILLIIFHLLIFLISILIFTNRLSIYVKFKNKHWLFILGILLIIINIVLIIFSYIFILEIKNKRKLKPLIIASGNNHNFDSDSSIEDTFGDEVYSYLTYKHRCEIVDLFEMKKNKLQLLNVFLTYENKVRNIINECKVFDLFDLENINNFNAGENNFFFDDSNLNFDLGITLEGMDEESRKKFVRESFVKYSDTGLLNLSGKDNSNPNIKLNDGISASKISLPYKSTRIYTGKSNVSLPQAKIRNNLLNSQSSIPYNNTLPSINIITEKGEITPNGQGPLGSFGANLNKNINSNLISNYNVISGNYLTSSNDANDDVDYANRNRTKRTSHKINPSFHGHIGSLNFNSGFIISKNNFGLQEIKEELHSKKHNKTKANHFLQPIPYDLNLSGSQYSKRSSYRGDFTKNLAYNKSLKDKLNLEINSNLSSIQISRSDSKKFSNASPTEFTDALILKDNKINDNQILPKAKISSPSTNLYLNITSEFDIHKSLNRRRSNLKTKSDQIKGP